VIAHPTEVLDGKELVALAAGPVLYLLGHNAFRLRMTGSLWKARVVSTALIITASAFGATLPALAIWAILVAILIPVVVIETRARVHGAPLIP